MGLFDIFRVGKIKEENYHLKQENEDLNNKLKQIGYPEYEKVQAEFSELNQKVEQVRAMNESINFDLVHRRTELESAEKQLKSAINKASKLKERAKSINYAIDNYLYNNHSQRISEQDIAEIEELSPSVITKLHCMDVRDLLKAYRLNQNEIKKVTTSYMSRYTTKANQTIYNLMTVALEAELQNILSELKYEKLDTAIEQVKKITRKYLDFASKGNQSIINTLTKFIGEIEYLYINAVKIEYNYFVKKEQARQEQLAIREQMRQEAEERKALELEKKRIEKEEEKYKVKISKINEMIIKTTSEDELNKLRNRILELQSQLSEVVVKKEEITNLQNGKAGTVYVISNIGAFGENVFKIGMTRRLDPQDRINELGNASVPFKFDVHSFIFSEDAVSLEIKLHDILNNKRVNKVNLRKEFFNVSLDELERIVQEIEPTAEFNRTIAASEYRQSISSEENYTSDYIFDASDDENDD